MFIEGRTPGEEGLRIAEVVDHPASLMVALWGGGLLALRQGDLRRTLSQLERAIGICQDADLPIYVPWIAGGLAGVYPGPGASPTPCPCSRSEGTGRLRRK